LIVSIPYSSSGMLLPQLGGFTRRIFITLYLYKSDGSGWRHLKC
jgi:hypothetical protein